MDLLQVDNGNRVWDTISQSIDALSNYKVKALERNGPTVTTAAPSGAPTWTGYNPFPGLWSAFPQADAKPGSPPVVSALGVSPVILALIAVVIGFLFLRR